MKLIAIIAILAAAIPLYAADTEQTTGHRHIQHFDTNKDGVLQTSERQAGRNDRFSKMDTDKNGKLSQEEFINGHADWRTKSDTDKDNLIKLGEYVSLFCGEEPKKDDKTKHAKAGKHYVQCVEYRSSLYAKMDINEDGKLTQEEFDKALAETFKKMDKNNDGFIEIDEFYAFEIEVKDKKSETKKAKAKPAKEAAKEANKEKDTPKAAK